ncbi:MAG: glyoxalase [Planctomycetes bacterium]|nr:glyoxalase [Planctomycetota bacterium]
MINGGVATVYVSDMDRAVAFYTETLGLKLQFRAGNEWASVDAGEGFAIGLHPESARGPKPGTSGAISVGLNVTQPIEEVVSTLEQRGVSFRGPVVGDAEGGIKLAFFGDPDGNDLYLCEQIRA